MDTPHQPSSPDRKLSVVPDLEERARLAGSVVVDLTIRRDEKTGHLDDRAYYDRPRLPLKGWNVLLAIDLPWTIAPDEKVHRGAMRHIGEQFGDAMPIFAFNEHGGPLLIVFDVFSDDREDAHIESKRLCDIILVTFGLSQDAIRSIELQGREELFQLSNKMMHERIYD